MARGEASLNGSMMPGRRIGRGAARVKALLKATSRALVKRNRMESRKGTGARIETRLTPYMLDRRYGGSLYSGVLMEGAAVQ